MTRVVKCCRSAIQCAVHLKLHYIYIELEKCTCSDVQLIQAVLDVQLAPQVQLPSRKASNVRDIQLRCGQSKGSSIIDRIYSVLNRAFDHQHDQHQIQIQPRRLVERSNLD